MERGQPDVADEDVDDQDAAALRIVWARMRAGSGDLTSEEAARLLGAELAATAEPLVLLSAVADVGVRLLGVVTDVLRHEPALVLRTLAQEFHSR